MPDQKQTPDAREGRLFHVRICQRGMAPIGECGCGGCDPDSLAVTVYTVTPLREALRILAPNVCGFEAAALPGMVLEAAERVVGRLDALQRQHVALREQLSASPSLPDSGERAVPQNELERLRESVTQPHVGGVVVTRPTLRVFLDAFDRSSDGGERPVAWCGCGDEIVSPTHCATCAMLLEDRSDGGEREARELLCQRCDREYATWSAPGDLWNRVVRDHGGDGYGDQPLRDRFLCPSCFTKLAEERGVRETPWLLVPALWLDDEVWMTVRFAPAQEGDDDGDR